MADEVIAQGTLQLVVDINQAQVDAAVEDMARNITNKLVKAAEGGEVAFRKLGQAASAVAKTLAAVGAVGGAAAVALATKTVRAGVEFNVLQQKVRAALTTILGTAAAAEELLAQVNELNDTSPFSRASFLEATQQLVGFGVEAKKIPGILDAIQQSVSGIGGNEQDILRISQAFARIASHGKLTGDVLLTLQEKGIDAAELLAEAWGTTAADIRDQTSRGMIGAEKAIDGLVEGLQEKFGGATENAAASLGTALDRLNSRIRNIGADITKPFINPFGGGLAIEIINNITKALDNLRKNVIPALVPIVQSVGEEVKKLSEGFVKFTQNINTDHVQQVLNVLKLLIPVVAGLGGALANTGRNIAVIGPLLGALNPFVLALVALAATVPEVRQVLADLASTLQPLVEQLIPLFQTGVETVKSVFIALIPVLSSVVGLIGAFASVLTPLLQILNTFGPLNTVLQVFIARMILVRVAGSAAFAQINAALTVTIIQLARASGAVVGFVASLRAAGSIGLASLRGIGAAIAGIMNPLNILIGGFVIANQMLSDAKAKADELVGAMTEGLDLSTVDDLGLALKRVNDELELQLELNQSQGNVENFFQWLPFVKNEGLESAAALKKLREERDKLLGVKVTRDDVVSQVILKTGESITDVLKRATTAGINFSTLAGDKVLSTVKKLVTGFTDLTVAAAALPSKFVDVIALLDSITSSQKALTTATKDYQESLKGVLKAQEDVNVAIKEGAAAVADAVKAANEANAAAIQDAADATTNLADAQTKVNELLAEGGEKELADARQDLADSTDALANAEERRVAAAERLAELLAPATAQELANANDAVTTSEIALARSIRTRDEALAALNATQEVAVDLAGLSLDGLKNALGKARETARAQRAVTKTGKSAVELQEDAVLAEIDVRDKTQDVTAAKDTLRTLELKGLVETPLITAARKDLANADKDVAKEIRQVNTDRTALNLIESGVSGFSATLAAARVVVAEAEERLAIANTAVGTTATEGQAAVAKAHEDAAARIVVARDSVAAAEGRVAKALQDQRDAQKEINGLIATAKGDQDHILATKLLQITANETLIRQTPGLLESAIAQVLALLPPLHAPTSTGGTGIGHAGAPGASQRNTLIAGIKDLLRDPRLPFAEAFRILGIPISGGAEGTLIEGAPGRFGKLMHVGEFGKPELLLPLTKPNRVWELLSANLPKYPGAMAAAQSAILPAGTGAALPKLNLSGAKTTRSYLDEPLSERTGRRIADLLEKGNLGSLTVEEHITLSNPVEDPDLTARLLKRQIQRTINRRR